MTGLPPKAFNRQDQLNDIRLLLKKAIRAARKNEGRLMQAEDEGRVQEAMQSVVRICEGFHEALFEQVHSVRVGQITADFEGLAVMIRTFGGRALTDGDQAKVRDRIKAWLHESRRWIAALPAQAAVRHLPSRDTLTSEVRVERLTACWLRAGGAFFAPPPRLPHAMAPGVPAHFQVASLELPVGWSLEPMDSVRSDTGRRKWECQPALVLELLDWAKESLLLEVGGTDRGGKTTFAQRRRQGSMRDSLAFSCIVVYERLVGPKSARQSPSWRRGIARTPFEDFVAMVHVLAIGGDGPLDWTLGPDPIRKAIATQRAWQKLFRAAGTRDHDSFKSLPMEARMAAKARLKPRKQQLLQPPAFPWV